MRTKTTSEWHEYWEGSTKFLWRTKHSWQNGTCPTDIEIADTAVHHNAAGAVRPVHVSLGVADRLTLLIAAEQRKERDAARREELEHEDMVDRYEAALVEGGAS